MEQDLNKQEQNEFTSDNGNDIIFSLNNEEDDIMPSKFYNFECITLYACIDYGAAAIATNKYTINTPLELYESAYMAKLLSPKTGNRKLMAFAVYVQNNVYDELDLDTTLKKDERTPEQIKNSSDIAVIRSLKKYTQAKGKGVKPYISYTVTNQSAIRQIYPLF
jgi:hypothetical protein